MARILVADDAAVVRLVTGQMLEAAGHELAGGAANGAEAIRLYDQLRPDVALLDLNMPEVDGLSAAGAIRQLDPNAKLVVMSVLLTTSRRSAAERLGARVLEKPFGADELLRAIA
jgi:two-component system chemotaxis response regulator CheY